MTTAQKIIKYAALTFGLILSVSIITGIARGIFSVFYFFSDNTASEMTEQTIGNEFTSLKINISAAELEIKTGEKYKLETNHKYLTYKESGETLEIDERKPFFTSHSNGMKVVLTIPEETVFDYANIDAGAGSVTIDDLRANLLKIELGAGELNVGRLDASDKAEIDGGAGSVTISGGRLNNADIDMGIGELNLTSKLDGKSSIDYGIGETNIVLIGEEDEYKIELDKGIGEARLDGKKMSDDSVYGAGKNFIEIDGGIGELNIKFNSKTNEKELM
ncbi:MAG: DUF4097 family beta strand repeat-containing protein [Clostridia bacterium]|nr:DUF4097 family beta strand repeat-containing protein [Clostridia bacterium]